MPTALTSLLHRPDDGSMAWMFVILVLALVGLSFAFWRRGTGAFYLGFLRALWRILAAPFRFVCRFGQATHGLRPEEAYPHTAHRAPLTLAALGWVNALVALVAVFILAGTAATAMYVGAPDAEKRGERRFLMQILPLAKAEVPLGETCQNLVLKAAPLDLAGRNRTYLDIRAKRIELFQEQATQVSTWIRENRSAQKVWEGWENGVVQQIRTTTREEDIEDHRPDATGMRELAPYDRYLLGYRLNLEQRIKRNRLFRPSTDFWFADYAYQQERQNWHETLEGARRSVQNIENGIKELEPACGIRWKAALQVLLTGIGVFLAFVWGYGLLVEALNLLLGHLENGRRTREILEQAMSGQAAEPPVVQAPAAEDLLVPEPPAPPVASGPPSFQMP